LCGGGGDLDPLPPPPQIKKGDVQTPSSHKKSFSMTSRMLINTKTKTNKAYLDLNIQILMKVIICQKQYKCIDILYELENKAQIGNDFFD